MLFGLGHKIFMNPWRLEIVQIWLQAVGDEIPTLQPQRCQSSKSQQEHWEGTAGPCWTHLAANVKEMMGWEPTRTITAIS